MCIDDIYDGSHPFVLTDDHMMQTRDLYIFVHVAQNKMAVSKYQRLLELEKEEIQITIEICMMAALCNKVKRKHRFWIHPILLKRKTLGSYHSLVQELQLHGNKFKEYFRVNVNQFEDILRIIVPQLKKRRVTREPISPAKKLTICLR